jgi:hypothetical protein
VPSPSFGANRTISSIMMINDLSQGRVPILLEVLIVALLHGINVV